MNDSPQVVETPSGVTWTAPSIEEVGQVADITLGPYGNGHDSGRRYTFCGSAV